MENVTDAADAIFVKYFEVGFIFRLNIQYFFRKTLVPGV